MSGEREVGGGSSGSLIGGGERVAVTSEGSKEGPSEGMAKQTHDLLRELLRKVTKLEEDFVKTNEKTNRLDDGFKAFLEVKLQEDKERAETRGSSSTSSSGSSSSSSELVVQEGGGETRATSAGGRTTLESTSGRERTLETTRLGDAVVNWTAADFEKMSSDSERRMYFKNPDGNLSLNTKNCEANLTDSLRGRRCADIKIVKAASKSSCVFDYASAKRMYETNMTEALKRESARVRGAMVSSVSIEVLVRVAAKSATDEYGGGKAGVFGESWMWWMKGEKPALKSSTESLLLLECTSRRVLLSSLSCSGLIEVLEEAQEVIVVLMGANVPNEERKLFDGIITKLRAMGIWSSLDAEFMLRELDMTLESSLMALSRPMYESKVRDDGVCEDTLISFNSTNGPYKFLRNAFEKFAFDVQREQNARLKKSASIQNPVTQTQANMLVGGGGASPGRG